MRQRNVKNRDEICASCRDWIAEDPRSRKGNWRGAFADPDLPIFLEIGSGKGQFLCDMARLHPEANFIAAEGGTNINIRILQKAKEYNLSNLLVIMEYVEDARDFFGEGELSGIYLNFCDPWPKARNAKRRLTHRDKLAAYEACAAPGAVLQLKTDNDALFDFSLEEIRSRGLLIRRVTRDLHHSPYAQHNVPTEYEQKFSASGKPIHCLQAVLKR